MKLDCSLFFRGIGIAHDNLIRFFSFLKKKILSLLKKIFFCFSEDGQRQESETQSTSSVEEKHLAADDGSKSPRVEEKSPLPEKRDSSFDKKRNPPLSTAKGSRVVHGAGGDSGKSPGNKERHHKAEESCSRKEKHDKSFSCRYVLTDEKRREGYKYLVPPKPKPIRVECFPGIQLNGDRILECIRNPSKAHQAASAAMKYRGTVFSKHILDNESYRISVFEQGKLVRYVSVKGAKKEGRNYVKIPEDIIDNCYRSKKLRHSSGSVHFNFLYIEPENGTDLIGFVLPIDEVSHTHLKAFPIVRAPVCDIDKHWTAKPYVVSIRINNGPYIRQDGYGHIVMISSPKSPYDYVCAGGEYKSLFFNGDGHSVLIRGNEVFMGSSPSQPSCRIKIAHIDSLRDETLGQEIVIGG